VPRREPEAEYGRPRLPEPRVSLRRREEIDAAAELDRICAARPLKPPALPNHDNRTRSAGALELAHQLITNDEIDNKQGDFAIVRVKVGLVRGAQTYVTAEGWVLIGFGYTTKTRDACDHINLVYRFGGAS
jgi:hypothetical protein